MPIEALLTSRQASRRFEKLTERTAYRRIAAAGGRKDPDVQRVAGAWCAPEAWWRRELRLHPLRPRGRPREKFGENG